MDEYNLEPGELVILQEQSVRLRDEDGERPLAELVLTDRSLILVLIEQRGLFKQSRMLKRCPLSQIRRTEQGPQVLLAKLRGTYCLQVGFADEAVSLTFPSNPRRLAERWADAIRRTTEGGPVAAPAGTNLPPEITNFVDGARDVVGALFGGAGGSGRSRNAATQETRLASVTKKCVGCRAPLSGRAGSAVACSYCDTTQTL